MRRVSRQRKGGVLLSLAAPGAVLAIASAHAQTWEAPSRAFARYGIRTVVCDASLHDAPCLGLACRDGALALVSASGGGGPMDGETHVSTGRDAFTLRFRYDPRAIDRLGVAASEVDLTMDQFDQFTAASAITLTAQSDRNWRHRFPVRGLAGAWRRVAQACASGG